MKKNQFLKTTIGIDLNVPNYLQINKYLRA